MRYRDRRHNEFVAASEESVDRALVLLDTMQGYVFDGAQLVCTLLPSHDRNSRHTCESCLYTTIGLCSIREAEVVPYVVIVC